MTLPLHITSAKYPLNNTYNNILSSIFYDREEGGDHLILEQISEYVLKLKMHASLIRRENEPTNKYLFDTKRSSCNN